MRITPEIKYIDSNEIKIAGITFQHGPDDYSYWTGFELTADEENLIWAILEKHAHEGYSKR